VFVAIGHVTGSYQELKDMKRNPVAIVSLLLFICAGTLGWPSPAAAAEPAAGQELVLLYANDVSGETEPCG
jgi:hypothetical protein